MKKILIVDDEPTIVKALTLRCKSKGYDVLTAVDGADALRAVEVSMPDLILLDVMMPPPNGYQVCHTLKHDARFKHIPIVMLTARSGQSDQVFGKESGADAFVTKPFNADELFKVVHSLLG